MTTKPSKLLASSVTGNKTDGYAFRCPVTDGTCGDRETGTQFASTGWPTRETAEARGQEHFTEHTTGIDPDAETVPTSSLEDFRAKHGLTVNPDGKAVVTAKDL